ncbi:MAG: hypothetical protein RBG1_1C00001G0916 [candidate division Zixibacteria bacterium RBG-1]|nr:MAG: hypothetical protein RBG1_1C00001G0916 [candidate division Zixibacteria bacterium RBG-1]
MRINLKSFLFSVLGLFLISAIITCKKEPSKNRLEEFAVEPKKFDSETVDSLGYPIGRFQVYMPEANALWPALLLDTKTGYTWRLFRTKDNSWGWELCEFGTTLTDIEVHYKILTDFRLFTEEYLKWGRRMEEKGIDQDSFQKFLKEKIRQRRLEISLEDSLKKSLKTK